ncbi:hypothetical protein BIW11_02449 [Tropilaelaps mercedesae]|uniref:Uncharacterized protein n=1 Tax=Tropilaelaps mercedesae TaxID=418985 RepID=A0A1V9Y2Z9_9ACAR|nr:hypothetical protein BIW11_02449 [Tropilaelaps mercedesae]
MELMRKLHKFSRKGIRINHSAALPRTSTRGHLTARLKSQEPSSYRAVWEEVGVYEEKAAKLDFEEVTFTGSVNRSGAPKYLAKNSDVSGGAERKFGAVLYQFISSSTW